MNSIITVDYAIVEKANHLAVHGSFDLESPARTSHSLTALL